MKKAPKTTPKEREVSLYEQLCSIDIVTPILSLWQERKMSAGLDGKFRLHDELNLARAWIIAKRCPHRLCDKWLSIYHRFYHILPPPCKNCWKVVMAPRTVAELLEIEKLQAKLGWPAKAGLEQREYTSGLGGYRAFWYCPFDKGLEGGRAHFKRVRRALAKTFGEKEIVRYIAEGKLYLKRGCTELERDFGPSDRWDSIDHTPNFNLLEAVWETPKQPETEHSFLIYANRKRWMDWAIAYGDKSVSRYIGGAPLGVQSVKYHSSAHLDGDFKTRMEPLNGSMEKEEAKSREEALPRKEEKEDGNTEEEAKQENLFRFESEQG